MGLAVWAVTRIVHNSFAALAIAAVAGAVIYIGILRGLNDALAVELLAIARTRLPGGMAYKRDL
jgi:hypothetical protein